MVTILTLCGKGFEMFGSFRITLSTDTTRAFLSFVQLIIYKDTVAQLQQALLKQMSFYPNQGNFCQCSPGTFQLMEEFT